MISLVLSTTLLPNSATAATSGTQTISFSIAGGDMGGGGGGGNSCLSVDYTLSTSLGEDVPPPTNSSSWTSRDINVVQSVGMNCPGGTPVVAQNLNISASSFTPDLGFSPNIFCDGSIADNTYSGSGATASCLNSTTRVNVNVYVSNDAVPGVTYSSTVTITAVL